MTALNAKLAEEHMLPMMVVSDRSSGEIITQLFNFVDHFPNKQQVNAESKSENFEIWFTDQCHIGVEKLLKVRGVLEPTKA